MPEFVENFLYFMQNSSPDRLANIAFFWITPFLIFCICVWGFLELWLDRRQGLFVDKMKWISLHVTVPKDAIQTPKGIENFFTALSGAKSGATYKEKWFDGKIQPWFSFELISEGGRIGYYIRTQEKHRDYIEAAFYAQYPEAQFSVVEDYAEKIPTDYPNDDYDMWGTELSLKKDDFYPIRTWESFEHQGEKDIRFKDPLMNVLETLGAMREGEHYYIQLLISPPDDQDWTKAGQKQIDKMFGKPEPAKKKGFLTENFAWLPAGLVEQTIGMALGGDGGDEKKQDDFKAFKITPFEKDVIDAINQKITKVGWLAKIRVIYWAKKEVIRKGTVAPMTKGLFAQYTNQSLNALAMAGASTPNDDYPWQAWGMPATQSKLCSRYKNRSLGSGATPKIMNVEELATIWHFPAADARTPVLTSVGAKQAEAPVELNFALPTAPILQNMDRSPEDGFGKRSQLPARKPLTVPGIRTQYQVDVNASQVDASMVSVPMQPEPAPAPERTYAPAQMPMYRGPSGPSVAVPVAPAPQARVAPSEPAPTLPVMPVDDRAYMPRAGMPAPLPPGLDLNDQTLPPEYQMPDPQ